MAQRILIPLDGSKVAEEAVTFVQSLLPAGDVEVHLLTVLPQVDDLPFVGQFPLLNDEVRELASHVQRHQEQYTRAYLDMIAWSLEDGGYQVRTHIAVGRPEEHIVTMARSLDVDLIVMTSHGQAGDVQWRYGHVTERVLCASNRPVLVVPVRGHMLAAAAVSDKQVAP